MTSSSRTPRKWNKGDPEPLDVTQVVDRGQRRWCRYLRTCHAEDGYGWHLRDIAGPTLVWDELAELNGPLVAFVVAPPSSSPQEAPIPPSLVSVDTGTPKQDDSGELRAEVDPKLRVAAMTAMGHHDSDIGDMFGGYMCACENASWLHKIRDYPPGGACSDGWEAARKLLLAGWRPPLPADEFREEKRTGPTCVTIRRLVGPWEVTQ